MPLHCVKEGLQFLAAGVGMIGAKSEKDGLFPDWLGFGGDTLDEHLLSDGIDVVNAHTFQLGVALHICADL